MSENNDILFNASFNHLKNRNMQFFKNLILMKCISKMEDIDQRQKSISIKSIRELGWR